MGYLHHWIFDQGIRLPYLSLACGRWQVELPRTLHASSLWAILAETRASGNSQLWLGMSKQSSRGWKVLDILLPRALAKCQCPHTDDMLRKFWVPYTAAYLWCWVFIAKWWQWPNIEGAFEQRGAAWADWWYSRCRCAAIQLILSWGPPEWIQRERERKILRVYVTM